MKFHNLFRRSKTSEKEIAEQRLRLILAHDRANISPGLLEILKDEIIAVISKHLDVDATKVDVSFTRDQRETRLVADIPLGRARESHP
jgi:cell division topological specificity factor